MTRNIFFATVTLFISYLAAFALDFEAMVWLATGVICVYIINQWMLMKSSGKKEDERYG